jgi:hypothetical protein
MLPIIMLFPLPEPLPPGEGKIVGCENLSSSATGKPSAFDH